ncbi:MAG: hydrolase [Candidatus Hydrogenedens sp.]|jgi:nicotinamidase-related amidase|nr:hydrolase [Candidatus Hydrogenedens sp.]
MLRKENTVLLVIDIQDVLMPENEKVSRNYLKQCSRLIRVMQALEVPILVTEQYPDRLGATNEELLSLLGDTPRQPKIEFSCLANTAFREALEKTGRKQLLIIGMETHICVMQTALEALDEGYEVYVVRDAVVSTREREYKAGLERLARGGAEITTTEMSIFELLRQGGTPEFKKVLPLIKE